MRLAHACRRVVTCDRARASQADPLGVIEDGLLVVDDGTVTWIGRRADAPDGVVVVDHGARVLTPGLVDAHTHACWSGSRHDEYAVRMSGGDYEAIARAGGGILSTYRAVQASTEESLADELRRRLARMASLGVTSVEVKSGYGLDPADELKQLRSIAAAGRHASSPRIVATYLALHALPPPARSAREAYVARVVEEVIPEVAEAGMASFVDAYVDRAAFSTAEARAVFEAASRAGLGVRAHVGQFADLGGASLAAEVGAKSVDHLEHVDEGGLRQLAAARVAAVLLPVASFTLGQAAPPVRQIRDAGVSIVVASDANPGTAPTESLPLALAFAVRLYGLEPWEAILGATRLAAESLETPGSIPSARCGSLSPGFAADFVVWDLPHETAIVQPWGASRTHLVVRGGVTIHAA